MNISFEIKDPQGLKKGELLIYNGKQFEVITLEEITKEVSKELKSLKEQILLLQQENVKTRDLILKRQKRFLSAFVKRGV